MVEGVEGRVVGEGDDVDLDDFGVALDVALDDDLVLSGSGLGGAVAGDGAVGGDGAVVAGLLVRGQEVPVRVDGFGDGRGEAVGGGGGVDGGGGVGDGGDGAGCGDGEGYVGVVCAHGG